MLYIVKYKLEKKSEVIEKVYHSKDEVLFLIQQIQRGLFSIDGKTFNNTMKDFEIFDVVEQNFNIIDNEGEYLCFNEKGSVKCVDPHKANITNELLKKRNVTGDSIGNIFLADNTVYVLGDDFLLTNGSKEREIIELLLDLQKKRKSNFFDYMELKSFYNQSEKTFKELKSNHISLDGIRNTLKNKIKAIKGIIGKDIISIKVKGITINI